jgi:hypothetical protein
VGKIVLQQNPDGSSPAIAVRTGARHVFVLRRPALHVQRLYHDDAPVRGAEFTLELVDGSLIKGRTDDKGEARLTNLVARPKRVQFGPDAREYAPLEEPENPEYQQDMSAADIEALVDARLSGS